MKRFIIILIAVSALTATAQEVEEDAICLDTIELTFLPIPQIPIVEIDSLIICSPADRYAVVYKDSKCGVYDLTRKENVTLIKYAALNFSFREEMDGDYYTSFSWDEESLQGVIVIAENNNHFVEIAMPNNDEEDDSL